MLEGLHRSGRAADDLGGLGDTEPGDDAEKQDVALGRRELREQRGGAGEAESVHHLRFGVDRRPVEVLGSRCGMRRRPSRRLPAFVDGEVVGDGVDPGGESGCVAAESVELVEGPEEHLVGGRLRVGDALGPEIPGHRGPHPLVDEAHRTAGSGTGAGDERVETGLTGARAASFRHPTTVNVLIAEPDTAGCRACDAAANIGLDEEATTMTAWNQPLTPLSFLERSAAVFGDRVAVVDGDRRFTYSELDERSARLAGALVARRGGEGARVAVLAPNTRVLLEAHYGVPRSGSVLVAMNTRLAPAELAYILDHADAEVFVFDHELRDTALAAVERSGVSPTLVEADGPEGEYESMLAAAEPFSAEVEDETAMISINYTSGTTGHPKGVMYHHRGAYLQALAMAYHSRLDASSVFMWTLPMFHCNGWTYTWAVTAAGATHLCLRSVDPAELWRLIRTEGVTHFNGAPTVLTMLAYDPAAAPVERPVRVATGGAPPSPTILELMAALNMDVTHLYGLTETFGPVLICDWRPEWSDLDLADQARIKARQGVGNVISGRARVVDDAGADVPANGETIGEIALRGNNLMAGYYRAPAETAAAIPDGWFRTGDLGVMHPDGYVELKDRSKDVIISGGENIASIEVEQAVVSHPDVMEAAVIAVPDEKWGEVPAAFVTLREGGSATAAEIITHVKSQIASFKAPKHVTFGPLPKTSTGKVQKYVLRDAAWAGREKRIH